MFKPNDAVTYQLNKTTRGNAVIKMASAAKRNHFYIVTETQGTILVPVSELVAA